MAPTAGLSLTPHNTLRLESQAAFGRAVQTVDELAEALHWARSADMPVCVLGEGSNVILPEQLEACVILNRLNGIETLSLEGDAVRLRVAAGENWHHLVTHTVANGWFGLENLALIPGTVGAAPVQNIGAYGVEVASVIEAVHGLDMQTSEPVSLSAEACQFGYRDSAFKGALRGRIAITAVDIRLSTQSHAMTAYPGITEQLAGRPITPANVLDAVVALRQQKLPDPAVEPNAGSFFKNPVVQETLARSLAERYPNMPQYSAIGGTKLSAAWLIDKLGWRGKTHAGFRVSPRHALVLVNEQGKHAADLLAFAQRIQSSVREAFDVELTIEPDCLSGS